MTLDDPTTLLAIVLVALLVGYQIMRQRNGKKRNGLQTMGFVVLALGVLVLVLLDFVTAFIFFSVGIVFMMIGEFISKVTQVSAARR